MKKYEIEIDLGNYNCIGFMHIKCEELKQIDVDFLMADGVEITFGGPVNEIKSITIIS